MADEIIVYQPSPILPLNESLALRSSRCGNPCVTKKQRATSLLHGATRSAAGGLTSAPLNLRLKLRLRIYLAKVRDRLRA